MSLLEPNVIVDFEVENEIVFLRISNHSDVEAIDITLKPNRIIYGLHKKQRINNLKIFQGIKYLAPRKEIRIVINQIDHFFILNTKPLYRFTIYFKNSIGKKIKKSIYHDLNIYRDIPRIINSNSSRNSVLDKDM